VIGGMLGATAIAVFFIPMFYWGIESIGSRKTGGKETPHTGPSAPPPNTGGPGSQHASPSARREGE